MIFLSTDFAIYKRLVGYPLDSQGRPQLDAQGVPVNREVIGPPDLNPFEKVYDELTKTMNPFYPVLPSYGIRIPMQKSGHAAIKGSTSKDPQAVRLHKEGFEPRAFRQVPVFDENVSGRAWAETWPSVSFRENSTEAEGNTYVYHDPFNSLDEKSAPVSIKNEKGEVIATGYSARKVRPHPESYNFQYIITARAKTKWELGFLMGEIVRLFPQKGALTVSWQDGTTHTCDMILERIVTLDGLQDEVLQTQGPEEAREFSRGFVYRVEGYADNTTNQFGVQDSYWATRSVNVVFERILQIDTIMNDLVTTQPEYDANDQELLPFTTEST